MTSLTDSELLRAFFRNRDEKAFRIFADRHLALIFHTALRRTGSHALAAEIAQNVLCAVARKSASLTRRGLEMPAWLHRATVFEASKAMRAENSHHRRSQLQHPDDLPSTAGEDFPLWKQAEPHLDVALDQLSESDRGVLLLHFFENLSFPKIAARLGRSPAAIQKQSGRALEKLSKLLRSKGVVLPVGVLAAGLGIESAKAAPVALLATVVNAGLSVEIAAGGLQTLSLMNSHPKISLSCALLICALPLGFQQWRLVRTEAEINALESRRTGDAITANALSRVRPQAVVKSQEPDLVKLAEEAGQARQSEIVRIRLKRKLEGMEAAELAGLLEQLPATFMLSVNRNELAKMLSEVLVGKDPALAMDIISRDWLLANDWKVTSKWGPRIFRNWLEQDLPAAHAWYCALLQQPRFVADREVALADPDSMTLSRQMGDYRIALTQALIHAGPAAIRAHLRSDAAGPDPYETLSETIRVNTGSLSSTDGESWLAAIRELPREKQQSLLNELISSRLSRGLGQIDGLVRNPSATPDLIVLVGTNYLMSERSFSDPEREAKLQQWLENVSPGDSATLMRQAREQAEAAWAEDASRHLEAMAQETTETSEEVVPYIFGGKIYKGDLKDLALRLAEERVHDPEMLKKVKAQIEESSKR